MGLPVPWLPYFHWACLLPHGPTYQRSLSNLLKVRIHSWLIPRLQPFLDQNRFIDQHCCVSQPDSCPCFSPCPALIMIIKTFLLLSPSATLPWENTKPGPRIARWASQALDCPGRLHLWFLLSLLFLQRATRLPHLLRSPLWDLCLSTPFHFLSHNLSLFSSCRVPPPDCYRALPRWNMTVTLCRMLSI